MARTNARKVIDGTIVAYQRPRRLSAPGGKAKWSMKCTPMPLEHLR
jgi:hypothetical protein